MSDMRQNTIEDRLAKHEADLDDALALLYGHRSDLGVWRERILDAAKRAHAGRPLALKALDTEREQAGAAWFQDQKMLGYMCYPDLFAGDFNGLRSKIPYLQDLGVTYLHLLSVLKARDGDSDGGFAVADYRDINQNLGTIDDLALLTERLRASGISLCLDFAFNHTADTHDWARRAAAGDAEYQDYYLMFDDRTLPDQYEVMLEQVFPQTAPGNFSLNKASGKYVWTTFYPFQWDLNYANPAVLVAMLENLLFLANQGVEIFRLDAAIYVWKELGTHCRNLPQTHALLQLLRAVTSIAAPAVALKAEAVAGARHITKYFGADDKAGKECQLAYHNAAMAAVWDCLASSDVTNATAMLKSLPPKPKDTAWVFYARCHDDIGWGALRDTRGATWGAADDHLNFLWRFYAGETPGSFACGEKFQPVPGEPFAGSNGTMASLAGIELALQSNDSAALSTGLRRVMLLNAVLLALDGIPLIYTGDEVLALNNYGYADVRGHEDGRWLHRRDMNWDFAGYSDRHLALKDVALVELKQLIAIRQQASSLAASADLTFLESGNKHVFAFSRGQEKQKLLCLANFSAEPQLLDLTWIQDVLARGPVRDITKEKTSASDNLAALEPYQYRWLMIE